MLRNSLSCPGLLERCRRTCARAAATSRSSRSAACSLPRPRQSARGGAPPRPPARRARAARALVGAAARRGLLRREGPASSSLAPAARAGGCRRSRPVRVPAHPASRAVGRWSGSGGRRSGYVGALHPDRAPKPGSCATTRSWPSSASSASPGAAPARVRVRAAAAVPGGHARPVDRLRRAAARRRTCWRVIREAGGRFLREVERRRPLRRPAAAGGQGEPDGEPAFQDPDAHAHRRGGPGAVERVVGALGRAGAEIRGE